MYNIGFIESDQWAISLNLWDGINHLEKIQNFGRTLMCRHADGQVCHLSTKYFNPKSSWTAALPNGEQRAAGWFDPGGSEFKVQERPVIDIVGPIDKDGVVVPWRSGHRRVRWLEDSNSQLIPRASSR
jgi:hypothetical protein